MTREVTQACTLSERFMLPYPYRAGTACGSTAAAASNANANTSAASMLLLLPLPLLLLQAENLFLRLIDTSLQALAPRVMEVLHRVRVAGR